MVELCQVLIKADKVKW